MMKITENVVLDLLPVYLAGEASEDTQALIDAYLQDNPSLATLTRRMETQFTVPTPSNPASAQEKKVLMRVKRILRLRSLLFGLALFFTFLPFNITWSSEAGVTGIMFRDNPGLALVFGVGAVLFWGTYAWTYQYLKEKGD